MHKLIEKVFEDEIAAGGSMVRDKLYIEAGYQNWKYQCCAGVDDLGQHVAFLCGAVYILSSLFRLESGGTEGVVLAAKVFREMLDEADDIRTEMMGGKRAQSKSA